MHVLSETHTKNPYKLTSGRYTIEQNYYSAQILSALLTLVFLSLIYVVHQKIFILLERFFSPLLKFQKLILAKK